MAWCGPDGDPLGDFLVPMNKPQSVVGDRRPVPHRVALCLSCLELNGLHIDGRGQHSLLTAVVEMQMRNDHCDEAGGCDASFAEASSSGVV